MDADVDPSTTFASKLDHTRAQLFVGRANEKAQFKRFIEAESETRVLVVSGAGGLGKSSLLEQFASIAKSHNQRTALLDARQLSPSPVAVAEAVNVTLAEAAIDVLMIDAFEVLGLLVDWLRISYLPTLPAELRLVLCGRWQPDSHWLGDAGWSELLDVCELKPWTETETASYLEARCIARDLYSRVHAVVGGNPLGCALAADLLKRSGTSEFEQAEVTGVMSALVARLLNDLTPREVEVVQAAAVARQLNEPLLSAMLDRCDVQTEFNWLRQQLFIERSTAGIAPHDLVREAVLDDLLVRDRTHYQQLAYRASRYALVNMKTIGHRHVAVLDFTFALREEPMIKRLYSFQDTFNYYLDKANSTDDDAISRMVLQHEGSQSLQLLNYWRELQPQGLFVVRDKNRQVHGFCLLLMLSSVNLSRSRRDPAICALERFLQKTPLRSGEKACLFRHWMSESTYQLGSGVQSHIFAFLTHHFLTTDKLGLTASVHRVGAPTRFIEDTMGNVGVYRLGDDQWSVGGKAYSTWGYDFRRVSPVNAMLKFIERMQQEALIDNSENDICILGKEQFSNAVRQALRHFHNTKRLRENPLMSCRLILDGSFKEVNQIANLRTTLIDAAMMIQNPAQRVSNWQLLERAVFKPAVTQRAAADALLLSYSTYRRRLRKAQQDLIEQLWLMELAQLNA